MSIILHFACATSTYCQKHQSKDEYFPLTWCNTTFCGNNSYDNTRSGKMHYSLHITHDFKLYRRTSVYLSVLARRKIVSRSIFSRSKGSGSAERCFTINGSFWGPEGNLLCKGSATYGGFNRGRFASMPMSGKTFLRTYEYKQKNDIIISGKACQCCSKHNSICTTAQI